MSWLPRIGLLLATLFFVLLLAEGVARLVVAVRDVGEPEDPRIRGLPVISDVFQLAEPNVLGVQKGKLYRTNSKGLRGPEYAERAASGTFRILVAGDSVTVGWGVDEEEAYPRRLQELLNQDPPAGPDGPQRFEVVNLGLAGVAADFASRRLRVFGESYHSDLDVYGFTLNDIFGRHYRQLAVEKGSASYAALWRRALRFQESPSVLLRELWPRWIMLLKRDFHQPDRERIARASLELEENYFRNPEAWADFQSALDEMAEAARARRVCGQVLIHTHLTDLGDAHPYHAIYDRVGDAARERGLFVARSFPFFSGRDEKELWVHAFDVHPNAEGHALLAQALYEGLRELPAHCWKGSAYWAAFSSR